MGIKRALIASFIAYGCIGIIFGELFGSVFLFEYLFSFFLSEEKAWLIAAILAFASCLATSSLVSLNYKTLHYAFL